MKDDNTTFKTILEKQRFDPNKLKEHFKTHLRNIQSIEVKNVPRFIRQMQDINNTELNNTVPGLEKPSKGTKGRKRCTIYVKHAMECQQFTLEMVKLCKTIWRKAKYR